MQVACSPKCAVELARSKRERKELAEARKRKREENRAHRARQEALRTPTQWANIAQTAFNAYINERDRHKPCIACGKSPYVGNRHASHYRSRAAAPQLRFDTRNVHTCCAQCNTMRSGNIVEFRIGLTAKIGEDSVKQLEQSHHFTNWDIEYYKRLASVFRRRQKHLKRLREMRHGSSK